MNEITDLPTPEHILDFWFHPETKPFWFAQPTPQFDHKVQTYLGTAHQAAASSQLDHWKETTKGCLALVILLDQIPRNIFRNTPQAFATDTQARTVANHALAHHFDQTLSEEEKIFLYLPYEHAEDAEIQKYSLSLFRNNVTDEKAILYAEKHQEIIEQFGRFPHRNRILGRISTAEEEAFLQQPGSSF